MELTREESKRILRRIELEAYSALVTALRAQGELDRQKKKLLRELGEQLSISTERHRAEIRRAISDDRLSMIAECVCGSEASVEWELEGRRVVPLMPRLVPQTAFTGAATAAANHAASVNSTVPSAAKGRPKNDDEEFKSRKRPSTSSPGITQKVIVSSAPKTSAPTTTFRNNNAQAKDSSRFPKTPTLPVKQESNQLLSKKMTSSGSSTGVSSKPIILGGSKSSSVSVAPSKYVAPLPASCLQAHASVVSGNKNRMNLNIVKSKSKPKFKQLAASLKIKQVSSAHTTTVASSVVQSVAQSLLTVAKVKGNEVVSTASKTVPVSRSTSTITVAPRSSISLKAFKTTIQPKQNPQSTPGTIRNAEGVSRQNPTQLGKAVSVSRLSRPLPAILPKTIPPKALSTVSSPGRKLASILPAPAKSTSSTLPNPLIVPVVVSSAASSSPIPIAPSPRPPQPFTASLTSSVMNKVTTVSMATGQSADLKRDTQETSLVSSQAHSPVLLGKSPAGSQNSSPISSKSLDNIHEREALSPVDEILTLVTSASSVPFAPSSPVKSKPTTYGEISLECDENLFEDLIKDDGTEVKTQPRPHVPPSVSSQKQDETGIKTRKDVSTLPILDLKQTLAGSNSTELGHSLQDVKKNNLENSQILEETSSCPTKASEGGSNAIDLSPLVNELISNYPFDDDKNQFENVDVSSLTQSRTAGDVDTCDVGVDDIVSDFFVGEFPVLGLGSNRNNVSETVKSDVGNEFSAAKGKEKVKEQRGPSAEQGSDTNSDVMQEDVTAVPLKEGTGDKDKEKRESSTHVEDDTCERKKLTDLESKDVNVTQQVEKKRDTKLDDFAKSGQNVGFKNNNEVENSTNETSGRTLDGHKLLSNSDVPDNAGNFGHNGTSQGQSNHTADATSEISQDETTRNVRGKEALSVETSISVNTSSGSSFDTEDKVNPTRIEVEASVKSNKIESESQMNAEKVFEDKTRSNTTADQAGESCQTNVTETQPVEEAQDEERKQENIEEHLSGSEVGSPEGHFVRTSNRKRKAPPPRDLSIHPPGWVRSALQLLQKVSRFRGSSRSKNARNAASWFLKPVETTEAPGYFKVIKNPMDFGTIKTKLEAGDYSAPADFHLDMLLVQSNCCKYNPPGHVVRKDCDEVFQFYEAEYERFVEKLDKIYLPTPKKQKASPV